MKRKDVIRQKEEYLEELRKKLKSGKPAKKEKAKEKKKKEIEVDADLNDDGVVDEKDLSLAHKAYAKAKKKKKIVKKK